MAFRVREEIFERIKNGLNGISKTVLEQHWALYKGYVANSNTLRQEIIDAHNKGDTTSLTLVDRRRRLGFELNGFVLHELYFSNLRNNAGSERVSTKFKCAVESSFGTTFDTWKKAFADAGLTRSVGWVILYFDPITRTMTNNWIQLHEDGNVAGWQPLLVMDVWEHAYILDSGATGRSKYLQAFMANVDWKVVEERWRDARDGKTVRRFAV